MQIVTWLIRIELEKLGIDVDEVLEKLIPSHSHS